MSLKLRPYLVVIIIIIFFDQLSKYIINSTFFLGESKQVLGELIRFTFVFNPGGAFGITFGNYFLYTILSLAAVIAVIAYFFKADGQPKFIKLCFAMVVGGAVGNMIDRIMFGKVIDFIDVGIKSSRWYTFNIADSAITTGICLLILQELLPRRNRSEKIPVQSGNENDDSEQN